MRGQKSQRAPLRAALAVALAVALAGAGLLACDVTAVRLLIVGELRVPDDVDELLVRVEADDEHVESRHGLVGPTDTLRESLTLLPGEAMGEAIAVRVEARRDGLVRAQGTASARFSAGVVDEVVLTLAPLVVPADGGPADGGLADGGLADGGPADAGLDCIDADGDGYGVGTDCLGFDCDDADPDVFQGAPELCDGKDNSCNFAIDEGCPCTLGQTRLCGVVRGICRPGGQACSTGSWGECSGDLPEREVCDGQDNDCDGHVDNGCIDP